MIWNDCEKQLLRFLHKLDKCHRTIKFTYSSFKPDAISLDNKLKKSDAGILETSVHD